jgi:CRISPR-associated endoribonuclease Cas6
MRFLTPTSFRIGIGNLALPLQASVYRGLWQKWQRFAPPTLGFSEAILQTVERHLFPSHFTLHIEAVAQEGSVQQIGFVGTCRFEMLGNIAEEDRRAIVTLSRFANYAGVDDIQQKSGNFSPCSIWSLGEFLTCSDSRVKSGPGLERPLGLHEVPLEDDRLLVYAERRAAGLH